MPVEQRDPNKPAPYIDQIASRVVNTCLTENQRFAAARPDVLVFQTDVLDRDVSVFGPITADLMVSTTGTDSDFVVKVIDAFTNDYPDYNNPAAATAAADGTPPAASGNASQMGWGYQQLVRGEPFRGKFRKSFEKPVAFEPGKPDQITFALRDVAHTWRAGHRIMVLVQSSWFPLTDRNPQKFVEISRALASDFPKSFQRVYYGGAGGSRIRLSALE